MEGTMTEGRSGPLDGRGAVMGEVAGHPVARHFGDPAAEYAAVRTAAGIAVRDDRARLRLWGRDPVKMLQGLITNDLAGAPAGRGVYAAMLTPKGRTLAELRAFRLRRGDADEVLVTLPREALAGVADHLRKFLPPMFAKWKDVSAETAEVGVYGPAAGALLGGVLGTEVSAMEEDAFAEASFDAEPAVVVATRDVGGEPGFDVLLPAALASAFVDALLARGGGEGARLAGFSAVETLRVEAGRPRYGAELSEEVIPTEAFESTGLMPRAISFTKGCYTGQEVIVRIAHRGHVNRNLRGLLLGDAPAPARGTPLFHPETGRAVGVVGTAAASPRMGQTVALAFVRRELEPGAAVRVGAADGAEATVAALPFAAGEA
jgi:folate-binding protein YgfZ